MMNKNPLVSVIIPTYNSEVFIKKCLQSTKEQTYKNIEVIVVDQSSTDKTKNIVQQFKAKFISLPKPKFYSPPTVSRNAGAKKSKGKILMHIDSDMILDKKLVAEIVRKFDKDKDLGALIIHEQDITKGFWSKCKAFERKCYWGNDNIESARAVRRDIFERVKGYDEKLSSGEDFDIHRRYKSISRIGFCDTVLYHNLGSLNFKKMLVKKYNYGKTASKYFNKHNTSGSSLLKEQLECYVKNSAAFVKNPIIGVGSIILKVSEFGAGGVGLLKGKL